MDIFHTKRNLLSFILLMHSLILPQTVYSGSLAVQPVGIAVLSLQFSLVLDLSSAEDYGRHNPVDYSPWRNLNQTQTYRQFYAHNDTVSYGVSNTPFGEYGGNMFLNHQIHFLTNEFSQQTRLFTAEQNGQPIPHDSFLKPMAQIVNKCLHRTPTRVWSHSCDTHIQQAINEIAEFVEEQGYHFNSTVTSTPHSYTQEAPTPHGDQFFILSATYPTYQGNRLDEHKVTDLSETDYCHLDSASQSAEGKCRTINRTRNRCAVARGPVNSPLLLISVSNMEKEVQLTVILNAVPMATCKALIPPPRVNHKKKKQKQRRTTLKINKAQLFYLDCGVAMMTGGITNGFTTHLENFYNKHKKLELLIMSHVPGGNIQEAMKAGNFLRKKGISTYVPSNTGISSAGPIMFLGGVDRSIGKGAKIGIHEWYRFNKKGRMKSARESSTHADVNDELVAYYRKMGISQPSNYLRETIFRAKPSNIYPLTPRQIEKYNITTKNSPRQNSKRNCNCWIGG